MRYRDKIGWKWVMRRGVLLEVMCGWKWVWERWGCIGWGLSWFDFLNMVEVWGV